MWWHKDDGPMSENSQCHADKMFDRWCGLFRALSKWTLREESKNIAPHSEFPWLIAGWQDRQAVTVKLIRKRKSFNKGAHSFCATAYNSLSSPAQNTWLITEKSIEKLYCFMMLLQSVNNSQEKLWYCKICLSWSIPVHMLDAAIPLWLLSSFTCQMEDNLSIFDLCLGYFNGSSLLNQRSPLDRLQSMLWHLDQWQHVGYWNPGAFGSVTNWMRIRDDCHQHRSRTS